MNLPVVVNLNPRSIYNKTEDFKLLLDQYDADIVSISESWERENLTLKDLLQLGDDYEVISNVKQRDFPGGKPALVIKRTNFM